MRLERPQPNDRKSILHQEEEEEKSLLLVMRQSMEFLVSFGPFFTGKQLCVSNKRALFRGNTSLKTTCLKQIVKINFSCRKIKFSCRKINFSSRKINLNFRKIKFSCMKNQLFQQKNISCKKIKFSCRKNQIFQQKN